MILPFVSGYWNRTPLTSWLEKSKDSLSPTITSRPSPSGPRVLEQMKSLFTCISMQVWIITSTRNRAPQLIPSQKDTLSGMVFDCLVNDIYMFWPPCGLGSVRRELEFEVVGQFWFPGWRKLTLAVLKWLRMCCLHSDIYKWLDAHSSRTGRKNHRPSCLLKWFKNHFHWFDSCGAWKDPH